MRNYLRRRRKTKPAKALWDRAKQRAIRFGLKFSLKQDAIVVPTNCPALGIPIIVGEGRSKNSPSLDRIDPRAGYVEGNVRVLSDHANRLKSNLNGPQLALRSQSASAELREDYRKLALYAQREALLVEVRGKAAMGGRLGEEWTKVAAWLERRFAAGEVD